MKFVARSKVILCDFGGLEMNKNKVSIGIEMSIPSDPPSLRGGYSSEREKCQLDLRCAYQVIRRACEADIRANARSVIYMFLSEINKDCRVGGDGAPCAESNKDCRAKARSRTWIDFGNRMWVSAELATRTVERKREVETV